MIFIISKFDLYYLANLDGKCLFLSNNILLINLFWLNNLLGLEIVLPAGTRKWSSLFTQHWWGCIISTTLNFGPFITRKTSKSWNMSREGQWSWRGSEARVLLRVAEGTRLFKVESRRLRGELVALYSSLKGGEMGANSYL